MSKPEDKLTVARRKDTVAVAYKSPGLYGRANMHLCALARLKTAAPEDVARITNSWGSIICRPCLIILTAPPRKFQARKSAIKLMANMLTPKAIEIVVRRRNSDFASSNVVKGITFVCRFHQFSEKYP